MVVLQENTCTKRHSATLSTILMIEQTVKEHNGEFSKTTLWNALPKKMMYQTFKGVIDYLEASNKIVINKGKLVWIDFPSVFEKLKAQTVKV